jgi:hypothetical protein
MTAWYCPIRLLEVQRPYRIVAARGFEEQGLNNVMLSLRGYGESRRDIESLLPRNLHAKFWHAVQLNGGQAAGLKLKYYGSTTFNNDGGEPLIRISGRGFSTYLV